MGREFELKFIATEEILAKVAAEYGDFRRIAMETTYYDTADGALSRRHITLRQRMENETAVCTVKTPLPDGSRGEWELEWNHPDSMVTALVCAGAPKLLGELTKDGIIPVCGAKFTRLAKSLTIDGGEVELALDSGILIGGGREIPLCELEVELKSGSDAAAVKFANALAKKYGLQPQNQSKFRRAKLLAEGS